MLLRLAFRLEREGILDMLLLVEELDPCSRAWHGMHAMHMI